MLSAAPKWSHQLSMHKRQQPSIDKGCWGYLCKHTKPEVKRGYSTTRESMGGPYLAKINWTHESREMKGTFSATLCGCAFNAPQNSTFSLVWGVPTGSLYIVDYWFDLFVFHPFKILKIFLSNSAHWRWKAFWLDFYRPFGTKEFGLFCHHLTHFVKSSSLPASIKVVWFLYLRERSGTITVVSLYLCFDWLQGRKTNL